jgi:hypothetical protein
MAPHSSCDFVDEPSNVVDLRVGSPTNFRQIRADSHAETIQTMWGPRYGNYGNANE